MWPPVVLSLIGGAEWTPYEKGTFHFKLVLSPEYPAVPPKAFFLTKVFHPNISKTGEVCVDTLKREWTPALGLPHVLQVIRCLLIHPNPESALNEEAGKLLLEE
jgi:ubiquitin-protein ligase